MNKHIYNCDCGHNEEIDNIHAVLNHTGNGTVDLCDKCFSIAALKRTPTSSVSSWGFKNEVSQYKYIK